MAKDFHSSYDVPKVDPPNENDLRPGFWKTMGAAFDQAKIHNPVSAIARMYDIDHLTDLGGTEQSGLGELYFGKNLSPEDSAIKRSEFIERQKDNENWLTNDQAREIEAQYGINPGTIEIDDLGVNGLVFHEVIRRNIEESKYQNIIQRGAENRGAAMLATQFAAAAIDPLNVASAWVPVFGQGKILTALRAAGQSSFKRAMIRTGVGSAEGFVGTAILEPLPLIASQQDSTDYTMNDVKMSLLFGTFLGGGMHVGFGYARDFFRRSSGKRLDPTPFNLRGTKYDDLPPSVMQDNFRNALNSAVTNRIVNLDQILDPFNLDILPGQIRQVADGVIAIADANTGKVTIGSKVKELTLKELRDNESLSPAHRAIAERVDTIEEFQSELKADAERTDIDAESLQDLIAARGEAKLKTLSETVRELGIDVDRLLDGDTSGINKALKAAKDEGYIPHKASKAEFIETLKRDKESNNAFSKKDADRVNSLSEEVRSTRQASDQLLHNIQRQNARAESGDFDIVEYGNDMRSSKTLHNYDAEYHRSADDILKQSESEFGESAIGEHARVLTEEARITNDRLGISNDDLDEAFKEIDLDKKNGIKLLDAAINCRMKAG